MAEPTDNVESSTAYSLNELVEPVCHKLRTFNPGVEYDSAQIIYALRNTIKSGRIKGATLMPDQNRLSARVDGDNFVLLVDLACKVFVDLVFSPRVPTKKRIPKHQKDFAFDLENEIYRLENGDELFSGAQ